MKYYRVDWWTGQAMPVEFIPTRCKAIIKGCRAANYDGDVPVQCSRRRLLDGFCAQHHASQEQREPKP